MTLLTGQWSIGGLLLGPGTPYTVTKYEGLGGPDVRSDDTPRPLNHGSFYSQDFYGPRNVALDVTVRGTTPADVIAQKDALFAAWQIVDQDTTTTRPLTFNIAGIERQLLGRPRRSTLDGLGVMANYDDVVLEYFCADPRVYGTVLNSAAFSLATATTGYGWPRAFNYGFGGAGSSGAQSLVNAGNLATKPTATITGPVNNPFLEHQDQAKTLDFGITLLSTDTLTIDFDAHTVTLNGTASRRSAVTVAGWWDLAPGVNHVRFGADTFDPAASAAVMWRDAWK